MATVNPVQVQAEFPIRKFGSQDPIGSRRIDTLALDNADVGTTTPIRAEGMSRICWAITADNTHTVTPVVVCNMIDGRVLNITPAAFVAGTDSTAAELNAAMSNGLATLDLSNVANHGEVVLRPNTGGGAAGPYTIGPLVGVKTAALKLTKAATPGVCNYTITAQAAASY